MGTYFILLVVIQYHFISFVTQIVPTLATLCLWHTPIIVFYWTLPYSLVQDALDLESVIISLKSSGFCYGKMVLETKIWALDVLVAIGMLLHLGLSADRASKYMCEYEPPYIHISMNINICMK